MADARVSPDLFCAWKGTSLLIVNTQGACGPDQRLSGYYFREARMLRTLRLLINGEAPWRCEIAAVSPECLEATFVHPDVTSPGGGGTGHSDDGEHLDAKGIPERALDIHVQYAVDVAALDVRVTVTNRALARLQFTLDLIVDADFADIQEAQNDRREQHAPVERQAGDRTLAFLYQHPQLPYRSSVDVVSDAAWRATDNGLHADVALDPQQAAHATFRVSPSDASGAMREEDARARDHALAEWRAGFTRLTAPGNLVFEQAIANNIRDFASFPLLEGQRDEWLAPQAGVPLYPAFFGRDGLTAGWQAGYVDRAQCLDAVLTRLGRMQSTRIHEWTDEEPGRVPYQVRRGPLALLNINPYFAYYADFASPLMFVISLANLYAWSGDARCLDRHWDTARRVLDWAREYGDRDGDGYLEYLTKSTKGTKNQGWKDSGDAIVYEDGRPVPAPIATCEIQGYWYIAQQLMGALCWMRGARDDAAEWIRRAEDLKQRFNRDWWVEEDSFFAIALDPDKQRVPGATSNVGHCLACGIIDRDHLPRVVERMFAPDMFSGWGIRTLSSDHHFYNPLSYHRGTVWAVEQATIAFGLRRFGFDARAIELSTALVDLARLYPEYRVPECVGGYSRMERKTPGAYPRANAPQLWNNTAFPSIVQTLLGLVPLASYQTLMVDPVLPAWLPEVVLKGLRVGDATLTLRAWRDEKGHARWDVHDLRGKLRVIRQPAPESLTARAGDRLRGVVESLL